MPHDKVSEMKSSKRKRQLPLTPSTNPSGIAFDDKSDTSHTDASDADCVTQPQIKRLRQAHTPSRLNFVSASPPSFESPQSSPRPVGTPRRRRSTSRDGPVLNFNLLPTTRVRCNLRILWEGTPLSEPFNVEIDWDLPESFDKLIEASHLALDAKGYARDSHTLYRKSGLCKIFRHLPCERDDDGVENANEGKYLQQEVGCSTAVDKKEWTELQFSIMGYRGQYKYDDFHLQVEWNYSGFKTISLEDEQLEVAVERTLTDKLKSNWSEREEYIPKKDLDQIMSEDIVRKLIHRDQSLRALCSRDALEDPDHDPFLQQLDTWTWQWATSILALCIFSRLPLIVLWHLHEEGIKDSDLPLSMRKKCALESHQREFKNFLKWQGSFIPHQFQATGENDAQSNCRYCVIDDKVVLPISFDPLKDRRGQGSYGNVYEVRIDPDHHSFVQEKHGKLALKIFHDNGSQTQRDFNRESTMLDELSKIPHNHVVPHLASFTHGGKFFMLFPLAVCNLKQYLENEENVAVRNKSFVLWLVNQMKGLAAGVSHLHRFGRKLAEEPIAGQLPQIPSRERTCFHHDLKPQNILLFQHAHTKDVLLKISDFGSGRVGRLRSGMKGSMFTKNPSVGTLEYEAPDWIIDQKSSRPYDIWSLGCIFLELLLWTFQIHRGEDFATERFQTKDHETGVGHSTKFWYIDSDNKLRLKPAVEKALRTLKTRCKGLGVFDDAVRVTKRMLRVNPGRRPKAHDVEDDFKAICDQAKRDLDENATFYMKAGQKSVEIMAPRSAIASERSRSPSVGLTSDEHPQGRQYLSPRGPSAQKSHGKSLSIHIPIGDHDRRQVMAQMGILPDIVAYDGNDSSEDEFEDLAQPSSASRTPRILLSEASMEPSPRLPEGVIGGIVEGDNLALQLEVQQALKTVEG